MQSSRAARRRGIASVAARRRSKHVTRRRVAALAVGLVIMFGLVVWLLVGAIGQTWSPGVGNP
jgi:hypothetical protein